MAASFRNVATFLGVLLAGYLLGEVLLFRSGFYARYLDPDRAAGGYVERVLYSEVHRPRSGKKEILVIGNSRIAEGFSAKIANQQDARDPFWFVNFGIPSTGDRVWYYLVRDLDPHRDRYAAIAIPIEDYADPDDYEDIADRVSEMLLLVNRIRLPDIVPYTLSFSTWKARLEVFRGMTIKGIIYQKDFQQFLEHPSRRLQRISEVHAQEARDRYNYGGMKRSLAGLQVDWTNEKIVFPETMSEKQRRDLTGIIFRRPVQRQRIRAFEVRWLGALVDLYRGSQTRIVLFQVPRGPAVRPTPLVHLSWTITDDLRKRPWVSVIDGHAFEDMERPEWFADDLHLNADGRREFSPRLADAVRSVLR